MKALQLCIIGLAVAGCGLHARPTIRSSSSAPAGKKVFGHRHILYELPDQFKASFDSHDQVTIVCKDNRDFGIHLDLPLVPKDKSKNPAEFVDRALPFIKKDIKREGKKEIKDVTQAFGRNAFRGFSYPEKQFHRETFDGVIVVGKSFLTLQIYLPLDSDETKYPGIRKSLVTILENMRHD